MSTDVLQETATATLRTLEGNRKTMRAIGGSLLEFEADGGRHPAVTVMGRMVAAELRELDKREQHMRHLTTAMGLES